MKPSLKITLLLLSVSVTPVWAQEMIPLERIIQLALEKNYDVQLTRNTAHAAETDERYVAGAFVPQVDAVGSKIWSTNDQTQRLADNSERGGSGIKTENLTASLQLTWTLFDGTKMFATRRRVAQIAEQGELAVKDAMVNTIASVINGYYEVVALKQQLRATREQMAVSEERVKLADRKLQVGTGGKPELLQAKVDLNAQRAMVLQQQTAIARLKDQLNGLVGLQLPENYDVGDTIIIDLTLQPGAIATNIENTNYSLQVARRNVQVAQLLLKEQRADYFPVVNFVSNYNFSRAEREEAINNFTPLFNQNEEFNYGFTVTVPILRGFNTRRLIRQAHLDVTRQELLYEQQKTVIDVGLRNAFDNYENAKQLLLIEEDNILLAKENVFIALEGFKRGITTYIELRTAQQSLEDAYTRLIDARYSAKLAETELLRLNGDLLR